MKGSWPHFKPQFDDAFWKKTEGVPMLLVGGDYEWFSERMDKDRGFIKSHPNVKLYPVADWESGHFDMTDALPLAIARFVAEGTVPSIPRFGGKFTVLAFEDRDGKIVEQDPKNPLFDLRVVDRILLQKLSDFFFSEAEMKVLPKEGLCSVQLCVKVI